MNDVANRPLAEAVGRRTFLKVLGSAGSAVGLTACAVPPERIIPYVIPPEDEVPGVATWHVTHRRHLQADVDCQVCHGQVQQMESAVQVAPLTMGWCVTCHEEREVSKDCLLCHY